MTVAFVSTGTGDAELLTIRAERLLAEADLVVYDRAVPADVLALAGAATRLVLVEDDPGQAEHLVRLARDHDRMVCLRSGDRAALGAGGDEAAAVTVAGIDAEIVPGVLAAFAGPALAGIPVMARDCTAVLTVVVAGERGTQARPEGTVVVLADDPTDPPVVTGAVTTLDLLDLRGLHGTRSAHG